MQNGIKSSDFLWTETLVDRLITWSRTIEKFKNVIISILKLDHNIATNWLIDGS